MFIIQAYSQINNEPGEWFDYAPYGKTDGDKAMNDFYILMNKGSHDRYRLIAIIADTEIN